MNEKHALLVILDGWGISPDDKISALAQANTPFVDHLCKNYPNSTLVTYGEEVGLPPGQMGNSEVGHLNIGAGRVVYQDFAKINKSISDGDFYTHAVFSEAMDYANRNNKPVHLIGLLSDGGVHAHTSHLRALCDIAEKKGVKNSYVHAFLDGRDVDPKSGGSYLSSLQDYIKDKPVELASVIGRYYAMDRDKRWERIKLAYDLLVNGIGTATTDPVAAVTKSYQQDITDEFIQPLVCVDAENNPIGKVQSDDVVIFYNFRTDRPREITEVLTQKDFPDFGMSKLPLHYVTMTRFDENFKNVKVAFPKDNLTQTLGEVISDAQCSQIRIAETEKYPHVTFFFSGGREATFPGENRIVVPSPKVATYDLQPEMSAYIVTEKIIQAIENYQPNFICLNYANTDMVGHTGDMQAAIKAAETVDECLQNLIQSALKHDYQAIIIADHGNSDVMMNADGSPNTAHTTNPVPCIYVNKRADNFELSGGKLADIAPTILGMLDIPVPEIMTGNNLLKTLNP